MERQLSNHLLGRVWWARLAPMPTLIFVSSFILILISPCHLELQSPQANSPQLNIAKSSSPIEIYSAQKDPVQDRPVKPSQSQCSSQSSDLSSSSAFATKTVDDFNCEQLDFCDDRLGFEAIFYLHRQLDEDANGDVDISESDEFLRDELKYENCAERQKAFHGNDKHITVDELWRSWKVSAVHNWSVEQTVEWLSEVVELPKYREVFQQNAIDGIALPRLAANTQLFNILGINNPIHKQKLALKAMDVVLFGVPKTNNFMKDVIMCCLIILVTTVGFYAYRQHNYSQNHIRKMMKEMEALSSAEKQLESLQMELERTKQEHENASKEKRDLEQKLKQMKNSSEEGDSYTGSSIHSTSDSEIGFSGNGTLFELERELLMTQNELKRLEQLNASRQWAPPLALQQYLQLTYEIEIKNYNDKRKSAEIQLHAAREGCDKLKKKRSTLLGSFRMAHGSSIDYVDNTILEARKLLHELTNEMQERIKRWKKIESFCGFDIIHNPGLAFLENSLYGGTISSGSTSNTSSKALLRKASDATLMDEDTLSLLSMPSSNFTISSASSLWPSSLPLKKMSVPHQLSQLSPQSVDDDISSTTMEDSLNGKSNIYRRKTVSSLMTIKSNPPSIIEYRRGSSDGVEKHFEQIKRNSSSQTLTSQSENSVFNGTYQSKMDSEPSEYRANMSTEECKTKFSMGEGSNEETLSSSSDSITPPQVPHGNGNGSSRGTKNFFGLRKRKAKDKMLGK